MSKQTVSLERIRIDGGTQARAAIHEDTVAEYADLYRAEADGLPPLVVFHDGTDHWLADGFHRYHAARRAELDSLACDVRKGTQRDAILYAVGANRSHGLKRTPEDKRKAVAILLADAEWSAKSDRWVAETAGVGHPFVADVRESIRSTGIDTSSNKHSDEPEPEKRKGKDGKTRTVKPKAAKKDEPAAEPTALDQLDAQGCLAGPSVTDGKGQAVPAALHDAFAWRPAYQALAQAVTRVETEIRRLCNTPSGAFLFKRRDEALAACDTLRMTIKFSAPYVTCPYCKGKGCKMAGGKPTPCIGTGWVPRGIQGDGT